MVIERIEIFWLQVKIKQKEYGDMAFAFKVWAWFFVINGIVVFLDQFLNWKLVARMSLIYLSVPNKGIGIHSAQMRRQKSSQRLNYMLISRIKTQGKFFWVLCEYILLFDIWPFSIFLSHLYSNSWKDHYIVWLNIMFPLPNNVF